MKFRKNLSILTLFLRVLIGTFLFVSNQILAATLTPIIAEVTIVRGNVTLLDISFKEAVVVKKGTKVRQGGSIVTGKKSFVRLRLYSGSLLSLGPESKMVVYNVGKKKTGVISLLKGKLRSKIEQKGKDQNFFIKTTTASLGVRGTDFQTIYNKENKVTSMLTYDGKVQVVKNDPLVKRKKIKGVSKTDEEILEKRELDLIENLKSKNAQSVDKGQYVGTSPSVKKVSFPIKISPVQFSALYKNDELKQESDISAGVEKDGKLIDQVEQKAPLEGFRNEKTSSFAARSGGFLDFETGLYIPPTMRSQFNERLGVYEGKNIGSVNLKTGHYIPPEGLNLDPKKGFVITKKNLTEEKNLKNKVSLLNKNLEMQSPLIRKSVLEKKKKIIVKEKEQIYFFDRKELLKRNTLVVEAIKSFEGLNVEGNSLDSTQSINSNSSKLVVSLFHGGNKLGRLFTSFSLGTFDSIKVMEGSNVRGLNFGIDLVHENLKYIKSSLWTLGFQEKFFYFFPSDFYTKNETYLKRIFVPQLQGKTFFNVWRKKNYSVDLKFLVSYLFHSRADSGLSAKHGLGFGAGATIKFGIIPKKLWIKTSLGFRTEAQKVSGPLDEFTQRRNKVIAGLKLYYDLK